MSEDRQQRAATRRATWSGSVVDVGTEPAPLYAELDYQARLRAFVALNRRVWQWAGSPELRHQDRSQWPGEVVDLCIRVG